MRSAALRKIVRFPSRKAINVWRVTPVAVEMERMLFASLFATEDRRIGMDSFVQNGPGKAEFTGR